jgi:hypothetical protein
MTSFQRTAGRIGYQMHSREGPEKPAAARAGYCESHAVIGAENFAKGDSPQGEKVTIGQRRVRHARPLVRVAE